METLGGSPERVHDVEPRAREFEDGRSRLGLGFLLELTACEPSHSANRNRLFVRWMRFVIPDDDLWATSPNPSIETGDRRKSPEGAVQHALDGAVVQRDGAGVGLVHIKLDI